MGKIESKTINGKFFIWSPYSSNFVQKAKEMGGRWDRDASAWCFQEAFADAVRQALREEYYFDDLTEPELITVKVSFGKQKSCVCDSVSMFNKTLAKARSRDSGAEVGADVALVSGGIDSGGSMKNWTSIVEEGSVFIITNVVKGKFEAEKNLWERENDCVFEIVGDTVVDKAALQKERARLVARIAEIDALLQ